MKNYFYMFDFRHFLLSNAKVILYLLLRHTTFTQAFTVQKWQFHFTLNRNQFKKYLYSKNKRNLFHIFAKKELEKINKGQLQFYDFVRLNKFQSCGKIVVIIKINMK